MNLSCILSLIRQHPDYQELENKFIRSESSAVNLIIPDAAKPSLIAAFCQGIGLPVLVITSQPEKAKKLHEELQNWCPESVGLKYFPEKEFSSEDLFSTDSMTTVLRLQVLSALTSYQRGTYIDRNIPLIVSSASAAANRTMSKSDFVKAYHVLEVGMNVEPLQFIGECQNIGYDFENIVEVPGTICRRGGIVDIYPTNSDLPVRIEFWGNRIDSIRLFDPNTQRSSELVKSVDVIPAKENYSPYVSTYTIIDYLPKEVVLILDNLDEIYDVVGKINAHDCESQLSKMVEDAEEPIPYHSFATRVELEGKINKIKRKLFLLPWDVDDLDKSYPCSLPFTLLPKYGGRIDAFSKDLKQKAKENHCIIIVTQQTNRLFELLEKWGIFVNQISELEKIPSPGFVTLIQGDIADGWTWDTKLTVFTDSEIFGHVKQRRLLHKRPVRRHKYAYESELVIGDYMVHIEHGIGRYIGMTQVSTDNAGREYLVLEYAAGDRLYVPVDQIDRVSRYIGISDQLPNLSRLNTQEWARVKQRVKKSIVDMTEELLRLYADREMISGFAFSGDSVWQQELESSFPYIETPDQLEVVQAVKADMETTKPMDRLVCGDVGYGKTEIALRAAFKAVMDNKQVAMLVPTTVLAQQHLFTFDERLRAFPIRVEMLSRLRSPREQVEIINGLATGTIDICIGTHRLLQKDIVFKDLGLLIVDEEQRFGVAHKEYLKNLRKEVDILTLSATPIPRTLHMSLTGIRDLSTIETPPEDRLPVKTYIGSYDDRLIREAILRELERNGQVFFVHNRVHSIVSFADRLCKLVPEAKISIAHGQMREVELSKIMAEFASYRSDVLITTTIIESGLDMPNVNTLIVDRSDKFGLTQLYQLRGRVGRGSNNAYAYFLVDKGTQLTSQARKRLKIMFEATEIGAGFTIAMKDLEIRGVGDLLGAKQSGHIAVVGYELYCRLLAEVVGEKKHKQTGQIAKYKPVFPVPTINLPMVSYIPEEYLSDVNTRIAFYRKLSMAKESYEIDNIADELKDRFGPIPLPVSNLLYVVGIKQLSIAASVESISTKDMHIIIQFHRSKKLSLSPDYRNGINIGNRQIGIDVSYFGDKWQKALQNMLKNC